eukprot:scaffold6310_cov67-Phaeocystis_antarctica.AAC.8
MRTSTVHALNTATAQSGEELCFVTKRGGVHLCLRLPLAKPHSVFSKSAGRKETSLFHHTD